MFNLTYIQLVLLDYFFIFYFFFFFLETYNRIDFHSLAKNDSDSSESNVNMEKVMEEKEVEATLDENQKNVKKTKDVTKDETKDETNDKTKDKTKDKEMDTEMVVEGADIQIEIA